MTNIIITVVDCSGKIILTNTFLFNASVNKLYCKLYKLYLNCEIKLLYNNQIISPLKKISDIISITSDTNIIFDIVSYQKLLQQIDCPQKKFIVNTKGEIIYWANNKYLEIPNYHIIQTLINENYNCLNIISICINKYNIAILFETGIAIILNNITKTIISTFYNVTKIFNIITRHAIAIIVNNLQSYKLIICNKNRQFFAPNNKELNNLDYKYIYVYKHLFFIINETYITIVKYIHGSCKVTKYEIPNIVTLYINYLSTEVSLIVAGIKEDNTLISFKVVYGYMNETDYKLCVYPLENINNLFLKIRKVLTIRESFISITIDDYIFIWGNNKELLIFYEELKTNLVDIDDIVVSNNSIGILKKNNSIILITISLRNTIDYSIFYSISDDSKYVKIISTFDGIGVLDNNNKVYLIQQYKLPIEILNNIKKVYSNNLHIIAISNDNIVYAYDAKCDITYCSQFPDFKSFIINHFNFIIIKNNNELVILEPNDKYKDDESDSIIHPPFIYTICTDVAKFIKVKI